jgi:hypothetical protein
MEFSNFEGASQVSQVSRLSSWQYGADQDDTTSMYSAAMTAPPQASIGDLASSMGDVTLDPRRYEEDYEDRDLGHAAEHACRCVGFLSLAHSSYCGIHNPQSVVKVGQ